MENKPFRWNSRVLIGTFAYLMMSVAIISIILFVSVKFTSQFVREENFFTNATFCGEQRCPQTECDITETKCAAFHSIQKCNEMCQNCYFVRQFVLYQGDAKRVKNNIYYCKSGYSRKQAEEQEDRESHLSTYLVVFILFIAIILTFIVIITLKQKKLKISKI